MVVKDSQLAHQYLDGLTGIEIGGAAHNPFNLNTKNVDYTDDMETIFKKGEEEFYGKKMPVDIVANGDDLPLENDSQDFVISSHVIEHFYNPIKAIREWLRVVKTGGYVFMIVPHKDRTFDKDRELTTIREFEERFNNEPEVDLHQHWSVWNTQSFLEMCNHFGFNVIEYQDVDDKVGNGFTIVIKK